MKIIKLLISPVFMGIMFVLFALSMAVATFVENDFGSTAAYHFIYGTKWFELILLLLCINLVGRIFELKLYRKAKLTIFLFHSSFVIMIIGAGITRYFGYEGTIHIREGEEQNKCYSIDKYIGYSIKDNNGSILEEKSAKYSLTSVSAENYKRNIYIGEKKYKLVLASILPNVVETITDTPDGTPIISLMVSTGTMGMENFMVRKGEIRKTGKFTIGFEAGDSTDISISTDSSSFFIKSGYKLTETNMMNSETVSYEKGAQVKLKLNQILNIGELKIVHKIFLFQGC
jgi:hypothetical protein